MIETTYLSEFPRYKVNDLNLRDQGTNILDKVDMCRILLHIIVSVFLAVEFDHKAMREASLYVA